jgi:hypothetical protein
LNGGNIQGLEMVSVLLEVADNRVDYFVVPFSLGRNAAYMI